MPFVNAVFKTFPLEVVPGVKVGPGIRNAAPDSFRKRPRDRVRWRVVQTPGAGGWGRVDGALRSGRRGAGGGLTTN